MLKQSLTTGIVAKIAEVSPRTVAKWCDNKLLKHTVIPGGKDRRIERSDLVEFLIANGFSERIINKGRGLPTSGDNNS